MTKHPHIVIKTNTGMLFCEHCSGYFPLPTEWVFPEMMIGVMEAFIKGHKDCKPTPLK